MAATESDFGILSDFEHGKELRKAVIASTVGTTIEWYDFLLYSVVTGLVFGKLFFPKSDPLVGVLEAFAVYTVGFIARPIGAAIFGHYGDRMGRKAALIATLLITGLATFAVAFVPTYESVGIWGAVILTAIRFIQGVGVGGEWGGSVLLSMEWARTNKHRGFITSWPQFGAPAGLFLANMAVLIGSAISGDQFLAWGWRVPFMLSIIMVAWRLGSTFGSASSRRRPSAASWLRTGSSGRWPARCSIASPGRSFWQRSPARRSKGRPTSISPSSLPTGPRCYISRAIFC